MHKIIFILSFFLVQCGIRAETNPVASPANSASATWEIKPMEGTLFVNTLPASECRVNGVFFGETPITEEVPVGTYTVICNPLGEESDLLTKLQYAEVLPGQTAKVLMKLRLEPVEEPKELKWFAEGEEAKKLLAKPEPQIPAKDQLDPKPVQVATQAPTKHNELAKEPGF